MKCSACGLEASVAVHRASERMYGLDGEFSYAECECGSLSLAEAPDLAAFYPKGYYSFGDASSVASRLVEAIRRERAASSLLRLLRRLGVELGKGEAIVDIGTGAGTVLFGLARRGYRNLTGIDPFLDADMERDGVRLLRRDVTHVTGSWDLVMFNHSLEHVLDPAKDLAAALALLRDGRSVLLVRIPIVAFAWREYRTAWVALDAPRHTLLPTERGMRTMIEHAGGRVDGVVYDSTALQFWGSELYRSGKTLAEATASPIRTVACHLSGELRFGRRAMQLNERRDGDAAAFLIRRR